MSDMKEMLKTIRTSSELTEQSIRKIINDLNSQELPSFLKDFESNNNNLKGVSLLSLKNDSLLSYLNSLVLLMINKLEELKSPNDESVSKYKDEIIDNTITQRVVLERGTKGLENKLNYQLEKIVRAYNRAKEGSHNKTEEKFYEDDEEDSDVDLNYKPNTAMLVNKMKQSKEDDNDEDGNEKYKPPKISAVAPPSNNLPTESGNRRRLQAMEEYINEHKDAPSVSVSVGTNIVNHGRSIKTDKERAKEEEVFRYEEENFIRLPSSQLKKTPKEKRKERDNNFMGEDWSFFNNGVDNDKFGNGSSRKRKMNTSWDKAKRKRN